VQRHKTDWRSAFSHSEARDHHGADANREKRKTFFTSGAIQNQPDKKLKFSFIGAKTIDTIATATTTTTLPAAAAAAAAASASSHGS
jgi:hypothetical protein